MSAQTAAPLRVLPLLASRQVVRKAPRVTTSSSPFTYKQSFSRSKPETATTIKPQSAIARRLPDPQHVEATHRFREFEVRHSLFTSLIR